MGMKTKRCDNKHNISFWTGEEIYQTLHEVALERGISMDDLVSAIIKQEIDRIVQVESDALELQELIDDLTKNGTPKEDFNGA
jgi:hypothetical protein